MSWNTSTWPSQPAPAPMPMVGIATAAVIFAPRSAGTLSTTTANAPASSTAAASARSCVAVALHLEPAELMDRLRRQADVPHHRDVGVHARLHGRPHPHAALELHRVRAALLQEPARRSAPPAAG